MNKLNLIGKNNQSVIFNNSEQILGSLILTFTVDLIFYEQVLVRRLMRAGSFNNLLLADQYQFSLSQNEQSTYLQPDKYDYLIKGMSLSKVFHPKAIWINKKSETLLVVGSGNVGYGGMSNNLEIFSSFSSKNEQDIDILKQFSNYINNLIGQSTPDQDLLRRIEELFNVEWLNNQQYQSDKKRLLLHNLENTIFEQIQILIEQPKKIHVISPFYDKSLFFLKELADFYQLPINVYFQEHFTTFPKEFNSDIVIPYSFKHPLLEKGNLHAKILIFEQDNSFDMFVGSPNATQSAMLKLAPEGNTELGTMYLNLPKELLVNYLPEKNKLAKIEDIQLDSFSNEKKLSILITSAYLDRNNYLKIKISRKLDKKSIVSINTSEQIFPASDKKVIFEEDNTISIRWPYQIKEPNTVFLTFDQGISNKILVFNQSKGKSTEDKQMTKDLKSLKDVLPNEAFADLIDIFSVLPGYEIIRQKHTTYQYQQSAKNIKNDIEEAEALIEKEEEDFYFKIEEISLPSGKNILLKTKNRNLQDILNYFKINSREIKKISFYQENPLEKDKKIEDTRENKSKSDKTKSEKDQKKIKDFIENVNLLVTSSKKQNEKQDEASYLEYAINIRYNIEWFIYAMQAFRLEKKEGEQEIVQLSKENIDVLLLPITNLVLIWWKAAYKHKTIFKTKTLQFFICSTWVISLYVTCLMHSIYQEINKNKEDVNYQKYRYVLLNNIKLLLRAIQQLNLDQDLISQELDTFKAKRLFMFSWDTYGNGKSIQKITFDFFNLAKQDKQLISDLKNAENLIKLEWDELIKTIITN